MALRGVLLLSILPATLGAQRLPVENPRAGMVITRSVKLAPGRYALAATDDSTPVITVRGNGIRVDLTGVTLAGAPDSAAPDTRRGLAILIDGGNDVAVTGGRIRGYRTGIRAIGTTDLSLRGIDLSDNWRPRLFSRIGHESLIDWLSFHHNENGEWRRFGAGVALEGVHRGRIEDLTVRYGMNGVMLLRTDSVRIDKNDFSFNSGVGIGLYRAVGNYITHNRADYNVRGYSPYFRRGQDSADLLMFEQSSHNVVAWNSMTHGGDGLFLWAGQHTMDTGEGGSNDNHFAANDFSWAPTNGMEATFSRNSFAFNRVVGNEHGLWGGYSYNTTVDFNCFAANRVAVAIEHGQHNSFSWNHFYGDSTAILLWADPVAPSDWVYPKVRDTRSLGGLLDGNIFSRNRVALRIRQTDSLRELGDTSYQVDTAAVMRDTSGLTLVRTDLATPAPHPGCTELPQLREIGLVDGKLDGAGGIPASPLSLRDRSAIVIDEWGPYDWSTPKLWPVDSLPGAPLQVLGPSGRWRVTAREGIAALSRTTGRSGDTIVITPSSSTTPDWRLELTGAHGRRLAFERFEPIPKWEVQYFRAPGGSVDWNGDPILTRDEPRLDKMWYRPPESAIPADHWGMLATSEVELPPGNYTLRAISDDGVRVWIDGRVVIDHWAPHESLVDAVPIDGGHHGLAVQYRQIDGWMELRVEIVKGRVMSTGSPGPH